MVGEGREAPIMTAVETQGRNEEVRSYLMGVGCGECDFSPLIILNRFAFFVLGDVGGALSRVVGITSTWLTTTSPRELYYTLHLL